MRLTKKKIGGATARNTGASAGNTGASTGNTGASTGNTGASTGNTGAASNNDYNKLVNVNAIPRTEPNDELRMLYLDLIESFTEYVKLQFTPNLNFFQTKKTRF